MNDKTQFSLNRRSLLKGATAGALSPLLTRAVPSWAVNANRPVASVTSEQRAAWVAKAETLKPTLVRTVQEPHSIVTAVPDPSRYLRWRMMEEMPASDISKRVCRKGDLFIVDFGGHRTGQLQFSLIGVGRSIDSPTRLRLTFGEVPGDVAEPLHPYKGELSSAWLPEEVITVDFLPQTVVMPRRYAFRYVKVEVVDTSPNYGISFQHIEAVALTSAGKSPIPLPASTPDWIKQVDRVSIATLRDCMQTTFEDGPRRDQRLWIGDLRLQARASYVTMNNPDLVKRCLYLFAGLPRERDGFLPACVFEKPTPITTETFILDYAALYGAILVDYVKATDDIATARELWPVAHRQLEILLEMVDDKHIFRIPADAWAFIDWNTKLDRAAAMQGVIIYVGRRLCELAAMTGNTSEVTAYPGKLDDMAKSAKAMFYREDLRICVSGPTNQISWASQAWLTLAGCLSKMEARDALRKAVIEQPESIRPTTPYLYHHVVEAMVDCGMRQEALELIKNYWGQMVQDGADTFWEAYDPKDSVFSPYGDIHINSFCHAWSCTPTYFFRTKELLG